MGAGAAGPGPRCLRALHPRVWGWGWGWEDRRGPSAAPLPVRRLLPRRPRPRQLLAAAPSPSPQGHGRSAVTAAAILMGMGGAGSVEEALAKTVEARPGVKVRGGGSWEGPEGAGSRAGTERSGLTRKLCGVRLAPGPLCLPSHSPTGARSPCCGSGQTRWPHASTRAEGAAGGLAGWLASWRSSLRRARSMAGGSEREGNGGGRSDANAGLEMALLSGQLPPPECLDCLFAACSCTLLLQPQ